MKHNHFKLLLQTLVVLLFVGGIYLFIKPEKQATKTPSSQQASSQKVVKNSKESTGLPKVSPKDWELILVNRDHMTEELSPELVDINGISVDKRIEQATSDFLAAAQAIDPQEHLISGYRSVAYQAELYQSYIKKEMANDPTLTQEAAEALVQTYLQPPGASEHHTGLAIDMSTVDTLNASDPSVSKAVQKIAPDYGFVLRFPEGKKTSTGVDYEDWHYRYVGKAYARYMAQHNLTLEEYIAALKEKR
ncbi:TPA: M15 family metallopeptidase [Streptococcus pyogenes]|uniref:M15 family metallopeptidase n=1 Tax=Streptococcus pyogenes TaxID=1314 RepID=UPI0010A16931|nr:D-alanyl-D-alanine carboxypeptidase family protein [Streptococcus pyogenes]VHJ81400.1 D-alanyl-D-alanine carboxypeptidase [Streptococcus pyogenes]HEP1406568.1 D-alanyl-D-alanine carboxypeptidase family protein [Streptococcus pyogenes]HEP1944156.1 D-alanyl-D-alanine carboxypeptidase family protein [Streptococcus pyogenes]HEQ4690452.1 D-alanyl-D-alanine carboxypeptidase family protein [Streptococcus pyogenes]HEQ8684145.1 D-alanyl-D-alanine carboxypeptidase family protein [Streptococcus pyogen